MRRKPTLILFLFCILSFAKLSAALDTCRLSNTSYASGEEIRFKIFYNVIGLYVDAGSAVFSVENIQLNNRPVYHVKGLGFSNPSYDWIFKVRDRYESFIDTSTLKTQKFLRHVEEGSYRKDEAVIFNHTDKKAISTRGTYSIPECIQDVLSSIYYARNIDFLKYQIGDKIPIAMFLDDEVHGIYIRYLGKEVIKTKYGQFNAIKFKPMLIKGTIFQGGELMTVWVTDDANHLPIRIESPITVGTVKVDMMGYKNLRNPMQALISLN